MFVFLLFISLRIDLKLNLNPQNLLKYIFFLILFISLVFFFSLNQINNLKITGWRMNKKAMNQFLISRCKMIIFQINKWKWHCKSSFFFRSFKIIKIKIKWTMNEVENSIYDKLMDSNILENWKKNNLIEQRLYFTLKKRICFICEYVFFSWPLNLGKYLVAYLKYLSLCLLILLMREKEKRRKEKGYNKKNHWSLDNLETEGFFFQKR